MYKKILPVAFALFIFSIFGCSNTLNKMIVEKKESSKIPAALSSFYASKYSSTDAYLSWDSVKYASYYDIYCYKSTKSLSETYFYNAHYIGTTDDTYTYVTDLSTGYYYYFYVVPRNSNGSEEPICCKRVEM